jgi:hypothetical protein
MNHGNAGPFFTVPLSTTTLSTAGGWDLFTVTADSSSRLELAEVNLVVASTQFTSWSALTLLFMRGSTAASTGAAITPRNVKPWNASAAAFTVAGPSSGLISTASAVLLRCDGFDSNGRLSYRPWDRDERITLGLGQRLNLRTNTPQIPAVVTGSILLSETGKSPVN